MILPKFSLILCSILNYSHGFSSSNKLHISRASKTSSTIRRTRRITSLQMMKGYIPTDISSVDAFPIIIPDPTLVPNIDIHPLEGGSFLGVLLWTFVVYNGLFGLAGRPADWTLPILAKIFKQENEKWFIDLQDGYEYFCPAPIEAVRVAFFSAVGYFVNELCITSFDGDVFWGWSIGICLAIPSGLINVSRDKLLTREKAIFQDQLGKDFDYFSQNKLERDKSRTKISIYKIIGAFRQEFRAYRSPDVVSDRDVRRLIRKWAAQPLKNDEFQGIRIREVGRDVEAEMAATKARLEEEAQRWRELAAATEVATATPHVGTTRSSEDMREEASSAAPSAINDFSR